MCCNCCRRLHSGLDTLPCCAAQVFSAVEKLVPPQVVQQLQQEQKEQQARGEAGSSSTGPGGWSSTELDAVHIHAMICHSYALARLQSVPSACLTHAPSHMSGLL
jgi:hypothetical protein